VAVLPIWLATWELDCCEEDFTVGDEWESTLLAYEGLTSTRAQPVGWTLDHDGFITISGQVLQHAANEDQLALVDVGQFRLGARGVVTSGHVGGRTRLHFDGHGPFFIEPAEILVSGVVKRIQRYPIIWRHVEDVFYERAGHRPPVDISGTAERVPDDDLLVHLVIAGR
jgi:hypothetical protein